MDPCPQAARECPVPEPAISVIVMNYNGAPWLERCVESLRRQTVADRIEVIVADNASPDHSGKLAEKLMADWTRGRVLWYGDNLGYAAGNNRGAQWACGRYLLFLNHDTWLEPDCLERLLQAMEISGAGAATPLVLDYTDDQMQSAGESGFDVFGLLCGPTDWSRQQEVLVANGPALLVERTLFEKVGGFDDTFFMYAEEYDLCWRIWLAGSRVILVPSARVHHRGAASVNPSGGTEMSENRTSDTKRFYANRNNLLVLLKNSRNVLLLMVPLQLLLLAVETLITGVVTRRGSHVRRAYLDVIADCWRLRAHIFAERRRLRHFRRHGDFWMLRFLRPRLNRWREFQRLKRFGLLKVDAK